MVAKLAVVSLAMVCSSAVAFVPGAKLNAGVRARGRVQMSVEDLVGADKDAGGVWDPLGLSNTDAATLGKYRAAELKHGRVAMAAVLGTLVQSYYHLPDEVFNNPRPLAALTQIYEQRPEAIWQIFLALGALEITAFKQEEDRAPGDLNFGQSFKPTDEGEFAALQLKELKNGRLAMLAIAGQLIQETLTGQGPIEQLVEGHISPFGDGQGFF